MAPWVGQASGRGAQLFGTARTLEADHPDTAGYREALRWEFDHVERGRDLAAPPRDPTTVLTPTRITCTEHWPRRQGHRARQLRTATG